MIKEERIENNQRSMSELLTDVYKGKGIHKEVILTNQVVFVFEQGPTI